MKLSIAIFATAVSFASAKGGFSVNSQSGQNLMSKARRVEQDGDMDMDFMADMSLKFMGCHHISQWNAEADGDDEVRIESKRLAKFRLCPTDTCNSNSVNGCSSGYGDYIVSMDDFLASYLQNKEEVQEQECEYYKANSCGCNADDDGAEDCYNTCLKNAGMTYCLDADYYMDDQQEAQEEFELANYLECTEYEFAEQRRRRLAREARRLEDGGEYYEEEEEEQYYIGTYCSSQGGDVVLGVFTDEACTNFVDSNGGRTTYYENEGETLPYSDESIVDNDCYSCADEEGANENGNGYYYPEVKEVCEDVYSVAGKCEQAMYDGSGEQNLNNNACQYIDGVQTTSSNGIINSGNRGGNPVASGFIGVFGAAFVVLGSYVYYLKTKLDRGRINLD